MLAGHCCFVDAGSSLVRGSFVSPRRAFGEPWEVSGMAPGGPERVPGWLMLAMGGVGQPTNEPQEGLWKALGGLWDGPGRA